jgi:quinol monooxygenase YgiN
MATPVRVLALFRAKPDKIAELEAVLRAFVAPTRGEAGCVFYDLQQNPADPADFSFFEEWESEEHLEAHAASDHIAAGRALMPDLLAVPGDVRTYRQIA